MPERDGPQMAGGISIKCARYKHVSKSFTGRGPHRRDPGLYPSLSRKREKRENFNSIKGSLGKSLASSLFKKSSGPFSLLSEERTRPLGP